MAARRTFKSGLFKGQVALVTGGTSGIGAATAEYFAGLGAKVVAVGLGADRVSFKPGLDITPREIDVTDEAGLQALFGSLDRLDFLVAAAGIGIEGREHEQPAFDKVIAINLGAVMRCCTLARPLLAQSRGAIVTLASMYGYFGSAEHPAYAASKGGVSQLTKSLAIAYAPDKIRVNAVAPGWIATPLAEGLRANRVASRAIVSRTPAGRWGTATEVAEAIAFLCAPAAGFITGAQLAVDGGYLCY